MPVLKLTDLRVKALSTEKAQEDFFDAVLPTFGVRVSSLGAKSFFVMYRQWGRKHRRTLGRYPKLGLSDARDLARDVMKKVESGADPGANGRQALTFGELANTYLELYAKIQKKSWREDHRMLAKDLLPRWEGRPVRTIRRADVVELLDDVALRGPIIANRTRALVSKIFSWGMSRDMVEANPAHGSPVPGKSRSRDRVLTPEEIRAIWEAVDAEGSRTSATLKLRLLTAQRGMEVMSMRWSDIEGPWWTVPAEKSKNGMANRVYLAPMTRELIKKLPNGSPYVFPATRGRKAHLSNPNKMLQRIREASRVEFWGHDLRRTAATHMAQLGISRLVIAKVLNHAERGVTAVYDRASYDRQKLEAWKLWGRELQSLLLPDS